MNRVPFNPSELEVAGNFPSVTGVAPGALKFDTPVAPRENYLAALNGEMPLWIPKAGDNTFIAPRVVPDNVARAFVFDRTPLTDEERVGGKDMFGTEWIYVPVAGGSMVKPGSPALSDVNDWEKVVQFPDIEAWDWEGSAAANAELVNSGQAMIVWQLNGMYERLISFMDFEGAAMALIDDDQKDAVHALFDKVADLYIAQVKKYKQYYNLDTYYFHDDWGSQRAPFFGLATAREMLVPPLKKIIDACHDMGIKVEFHSCGKNELLVPAMIEAGFDVWNGQPMNDKAMLHEQYGDQIIIGFGAADLGYTDVADEESAVRIATEFVEKYGSTYAQKPVVVGSLMGDVVFSKTVYELSRKMFS